MGNDAMVVAAAKVSTTGEEAEKFALIEHAEGNFGLINYLMKHRHGTPYEHGAATFYVHAPVFVWWEWVRHRIGFSYNLESSRYKKLEPVFWIPRRNRMMVPAVDHKPARPRFDYASYDQWEREVERTKRASTFAYELYEEALADGICSEVARDKLPFNIYFSGWVTCNPRSMMSFISLRTHNKDAKYVSYPQAEIDEAAQQMENVLQEHWPLVARAFNENGRVGP